MILDLRVYSYVPAKYRKFLKGYEEIGFGLTSRHLGKTLGIFRPDSGVSNKTFQFFMYEDSAHRDKCRKGMLTDPAWLEFISIDNDALVQQMNTLLLPTSFSPLQSSANAPVAQGGDRLFELRVWTFRPGALDDILSRLDDGGAALLTRHIPDVIGWFTPSDGVTNKIFLLSAFPDATVRDEARAASIDDPEIARVTQWLREALVEEEAQLLLPFAYSPLR